MTLDQLRQRVESRVVTPDDTDYDQIRRGWNLTIDQRPALILLPESVHDVASAVDYAREMGLPVAVQSTGHGVHHPANGALLIVTSALKKFEIDPVSRTVRAEAGVVWEPILNAAAGYGLAPLVGTSPHVGIVGYSLGGGIGWLARKYGLAADSVREIELVTADGVLRRASPTENADLFWGLRGSRGGFGVVTALTLDLYPVVSVYGGTLQYPGDLAGEALTFFRDWTRTVPDALTSKITILKYPSAPFVPEHLRGKVEVHVRAAFDGSAEDGARWMQPWLDWREPLSNTFAQMPFSEVGTINADPATPSPVYPSSELFASLPDGAIEVLVRRALDPSSPVAMTDLRHAGGAIARRNADFSAVGSRDAEYYLTVGGPASTPDIYAGIRAAIARLKDELRPYVMGGVYLNFMIDDEARERTRESFTPEAYAKLAALKAKYDPDDLFHFGYALADVPQFANPE